MAASITASPVEVMSAAPLAASSSSAIARTVVRRADAAMTTPYVFPQSCSKFNYTMTSTTTDITHDFGQIQETFLFVNTVNNTLYSSCQPTGWTEGYGRAGSPDRPSVYRGAVCPSNWVAFDVGLTSQSSISRISRTEYNTLWTSTWSSAFCCQDGHTLVKNIWSINMDLQRFTAQQQSSVCASALEDYSHKYSSYTIPGWNTLPELVTSIKDGIRTTFLHTPYEYTDLLVPFTSGRAFYPAMTLQWNESDNQTLDPQWPTLTSDMRLPTWTPGSAADNLLGVWDNKGTGPSDVAVLPPSMPNKVAIPVIAVLGALLLLSLGFLLFQLCRGRRRKALDVQSQTASSRHLGIALDDEAGSTAHLAGGTANENPAFRERGGLFGWLKSGRRSKVTKKELELTEIAID